MSFSAYKSERRLIQAISTFVIIVLPFLNILRLDIPTLRFYFFNSVLWIDEFYLLFLVLMMGLWILVIFSMLYGRVWCGWMCPQTVLSELYDWFDQKTRRWLRVRRQGSPWRNIGARSMLILGAAGIALIIGFNLVAYFVDPYRMLREIAAGALSPITGGIIIGIAVLTVVDLVFWREKFCTKACPYGMMQMVVTDARTQIVRYHTERADECIHCEACVRDCRMGIDIRTTSYQTECIHCGDCVDSCAAILKRLDKPTLITFSWGENDRRRRWYEKLGFVDAKRWMVLGITVAFAAALIVLVQLRQPLSFSVSGDRATLFRQKDDGRIYNDYTMRISNRSLEDGAFRLSFADGVNNRADRKILIEENPLTLASREVRQVKFEISADKEHLHPGPNRLVLKISRIDNPGIAAETEIVFFTPEKPITFE